MADEAPEWTAVREAVSSKALSELLVGVRLRGADWSILPVEVIFSYVQDSNGQGKATRPTSKD